MKILHITQCERCFLTHAEMHAARGPSQLFKPRFLMQTFVHSSTRAHTHSTQTYTHISVSLSYTHAGLGYTAPGIAALLGGLVFPAGFTMIIFSGTDLLTSNMLYTTPPIPLLHTHTAHAHSLAPSFPYFRVDEDNFKTQDRPMTPPPPLHSHSLPPYGLGYTAPGIAALLGGLVFPAGLAMIIFSGTDLLTL